MAPTCSHTSFVVVAEEREVRCAACGVLLDPIATLVGLEALVSAVERQQRALEQQAATQRERQAYVLRKKHLAQLVRARTHCELCGGSGWATAGDVLPAPQAAPAPFDYFDGCTCGKTPCECQRRPVEPASAILDFDAWARRRVEAGRAPLTQDEYFIAQEAFYAAHPQKHGPTSSLTAAPAPPRPQFRWIPMRDAPTGAGGQVWVAYPNPNHPLGWNLRIQWTPLRQELGSSDDFWDRCFWRPVDEVSPPLAAPAPPETEER
jgi:hypothetical protein